MVSKYDYDEYIEYLILILLYKEDIMIIIEMQYLF